MWKIWHKLFGWDYVLWQDRYYGGVSRVLFLPDGTQGYLKQPNIFRTLQGAEDTIFWLTCKPEKYIKPKGGE